MKPVKMTRLTMSEKLPVPNEEPTKGARRATGVGSSFIVRSSAAECLTFVAATGKGGVEAVYADENIWLTRKTMAMLYDVDVRTANYYKKIQSVRESGMDRDIFYRETVQMNNDRKQKLIDFGAEALTDALLNRAAHSDEAV